jgi:hypothetical protein
MKALERNEMTIQTDRGQNHARERAPDSIPEGAPVDEQQSPTWLWPSVIDGRHFETFLDGEGI